MELYFKITIENPTKELEFTTNIITQ
jgi:hypothetical protein